MSQDRQDKPQPDKFRDLARKLGCDEDEAAFEDAVRRIAPKPPESVDKPPQ